MFTINFNILESSKCCYKGCRNTSKSKTRKKVKYLPFPKPKSNLTKCLLWLELCGNSFLKLDTITKNTYICEKHFTPGCDEPLPFYEANSEDVRKFKYTEVAQEVLIGNTEEEMPIIRTECETYIVEHSYCKRVSQIPFHVHKETQTISSDIFNVPSRTVSDPKVYPYFLHSNLSKSANFNYFTGLTVLQFEAFYSFLDPSVMPQLKYTRRDGSPVKTKKIQYFSNKDKLCLTLVRIKRGYTLKELSIFYNISVTHISVVFYTWVRFIYLQCYGMRNALVKGSRRMNWNELPYCYRVFPDKTTIILDGTEFKMQMSKNFQRQGNTHSYYKHYNSINFLIGISPRGAIIYNSEGYEGSISDVELFRRCDLQHFLKEGDVLMVDRGFTIQEICNENGYKLLIPPFLAGRSRLTQEEEIVTKKIAKARIHVERAIQRIKAFQILAKPIQITMLPIISDIVSIVCFLINFQEPLVS